MLGFVVLAGRFEAFDVAVGRQHGEPFGQEVIAGEAVGDVEDVADDAGAFDGLGEKHFHGDPFRHAG